MSTRRLAESVEGLNSSLALTAGDLWPKKGRPIAVVKGLTLRELVYDMLVLRFRPKKQQFLVALPTP